MQARHWLKLCQPHNLLVKLQVISRHFARFALSLSHNPALGQPCGIFHHNHNLLRGRGLKKKEGRAERRGKSRTMDYRKCSWKMSASAATYFVCHQRQFAAVLGFEIAEHTRSDNIIRSTASGFASAAGRLGRCGSRGCHRGRGTEACPNQRQEGDTSKDGTSMQGGAIRERQWEMRAETNDSYRCRWCWPALRQMCWRGTRSEDKAPKQQAKSMSLPV